MTLALLKIILVEAQLLVLGDLAGNEWLDLYQKKPNLATSNK